MSFKNLFTIGSTATIGTMLLMCATSCAPQQAPRLVIVHTNDTHSQIDPAPDNDKYNPGQGGLEQRAAIIATMRDSFPNLLYFDAGDMVQGSPYFNLYKGQVEMEAMNRQGLVASTFGNHEFDNGIDFLANMMQWTDFPILSCNYDFTDTKLRDEVKKFIIREQDGMKIGITAVTVDPTDLIFMQNVKGVKYNDPSESANLIADSLRGMGCDLVILLSHVGYYKNDTTMGDRYIATHSKNIDLIIGGHTHTNIETGYVAYNVDSVPVTITQTGAKTNPIGAIDIRMKASTRHDGTKWMVDTIRCWKLHPEDIDYSAHAQVITDYITPFRDSLNAQMQEVLGSAPETMVKDHPQGLLGNLTADALRTIGEERLRSMALGDHVSMAVMNNGGLRTTLNAGDVTLGDLFKIYPFENKLTLIKLKGSDLESLLQSLAGRGMEAVSGCNVTLTTDANHKTTASKILVDGKPIQADKDYWISTIDYLAEGNSGMSALTRGEQHPTELLLRDLMIDYVRRQTAAGKPVQSQLDDRVK
jgi:5'-nucleotidase